MPSLRSTLWPYLALALVLGACGGLERQSPSKDPPAVGDAAAGAGGQTGENFVGGAGGEACAETERTANDEAINARTSSILETAPPTTLVPIFIKLIQLVDLTGSNKAERERLYAPYLDALEARLEALGATEVGRFDSQNSAAAELEARHVGQVLCWPDVVHVDVDAPYYDIAVAPWTPEEAGEAECPLTDGACPPYCSEYYAIPFDEAAGCFTGGELIVCQRSDRELNEDPSDCFENASSGRPFLVPNLTLVAPRYLGWKACSDPTAALGLTCEGEEQP